MTTTVWNRTQVENFEYTQMPFAPVSLEEFGVAVVSSEELPAMSGSSLGGGQPGVGELTADHAEEIQRALASGREQGFEEGRRREREAQAAASKAAEEQHRQQALTLVQEFAAERQRYLDAVEKEVVKLALAIAARILRREAQMDPLLLTGAVRVALGQLSGSTGVRLWVPPAELKLWQETVSLFPNLGLKPQVLPGEGMRIGDCALETELGSVDLGIRSQLGEIERGFFDRTGDKQAAAVKGMDAALAEGVK
jgi:flagellar biosynthesis/type III secretory pathway protein FliH